MKQTRNAIVVGHRGAKGLAPENTIAAFKKALEYHVTQLEMDLRVTADDVVVLNHDPECHGDDDTSLIVATSTYAEVKAHKADITTLDEAISFVNRQARMMLEVKEKVPTGQIITIVKKYLGKGWLPGDFMFVSYDFKVLKQLYAALPEIERGVLEEWSGLRASYRAERVRSNYLSMNQRFLWWGFIHAMSKRYNLFSYTLNDVAKAQRWTKHGLYGIITDYPDYFEPAESAILVADDRHTPPHRRTHA